MSFHGQSGEGIGPAAGHIFSLTWKEITDVKGTPVFFPPEIHQLPRGIDAEGLQIQTAGVQTSVTKSSKQKSAKPTQTTDTLKSDSS